MVVVFELSTRQLQISDFSSTPRDSNWFVLYGQEPLRHIPTTVEGFLVIHHKTILQPVSPHQEPI
jgi:hypothetical protein